MVWEVDLSWGRCLAQWYEVTAWEVYIPYGSFLFPLVPIQLHTTAHPGRRQVLRPECLHPCHSQDRLGLGSRLLVLAWPKAWLLWALREWTSKWKILVCFSDFQTRWTFKHLYASWHSRYTLSTNAKHPSKELKQFLYRVMVLLQSLLAKSVGDLGSNFVFVYFHFIRLYREIQTCLMDTV